jgi:hypothetical protein
MQAPSWAISRILLAKLRSYLPMIYQQPTSMLGHKRKESTKNQTYIGIIIVFVDYDTNL